MMGLIVALFAAMLLTALGMSLALLGSSEMMLAGNDAHALTARHAAYGAVALAESELRDMDDWAGVVSSGAGNDVCATPGRFTDTVLMPAAPWGGPGIDLHALTLRLQADSDGAAPAGVPGTVWRLFAYGPISRLIPPPARPPPLYLVVWVADGGSGLLLIHAAALGPSGLVKVVDASAGREPDGTSLRRITVRGAS